MRFSVQILTAVSLYASRTFALGSLGFNLGVQNNDGSCKTASDYESDLDTLSAYTSTIKVYSAANCDTLQIFGPVAEAAGITIVLGIAATGTYDEEKAALQSYLPNLKKSTIEFIGVGSESLYRADITADDLASEISEIQDLIADIEDSNGDSYKGTKVGTVDSWNILVDGANAAVVKASDVVYANAFSYWQGQTMKNNHQGIHRY
ncbi:unnamed protein product [Kuraishia capsulata CBS 1993]|uniref:glucan 1,3-beta-glucosidase n=1 Tax=Kuraishia capsulata CBS 1993 TaxID=1382522 RepID=W6MXI2_9ASCO|nr:uncharacterized protein KUCA_T00004921001 [Kuraishia capsulata CBS 1993]CDK28935.1 unnamed protein product [Kuraishia capsulata CBS 1993]